MITVKFNEAQAKRINEKLRKIAENATGPQSKLYFRVEIILQGYVDAVVKAMGTMSAGTYGDPQPATGTLEFDQDSTWFHWEPLSKRTIAYKQKNKLVDGAEVTFWYATGKARKSVKIFKKLTKYQQKAFAGIDGTKNPEGFEHAIRAEFGGMSDEGHYVPNRALFTLLNEIFRKHRQKILTELRSELLTGVNWGR